MKHRVTEAVCHNAMSLAVLASSGGLGLCYWVGQFICRAAGQPIKVKVKTGICLYSHTTNTFTAWTILIENLKKLYKQY